MNVRVKTGENRDLLEILTNVMNCYTHILHHNGLIDNPIYYKYTGDDILTREEAEKLPGMTVTVPSYGNVHILLAHRRYDYTTGKFAYIEINGNAAPASLI